jgi:hypothetical protein
MAPSATRIRSRVPAGASAVDLNTAMEPDATWTTA